jgi:hypothetical protein
MIKRLALQLASQVLLESARRVFENVEYSYPIKLGHGN